MNDSGALHLPKQFFGKLPEKLLHDKSITDGAKVLYAHMHWRYGSNETNFEGRANMAEYLGVSEQTISNRINELESHSWIVVVMRDRKADGNYQTPFYHVFVKRAAAAEFRTTYQIKDGEMVRQKPATKTRKARTGVGGKPQHKPKETAQTQVDGVNSSLPHGANLSFHYLDSFYPDSVLKESVASDVLIIALKHDASTFKRVVKAAGGLTNYNARMRSFWQVAARYFDLAQRYPDATPEAIEIRMNLEDLQEMKRRAGIEHQTQGANTAAATAVIEMQKAVKDVIGFSEGAGLDFVKMFMDTCKKTSTFKDHAIPGGITAQELRDWYAYYQAVQAAVKPAGQLRVPSTLHRYITTWIEAGKPLINAPKPINAMSGIRLLNGKQS